jgi:hypothetical protein
MPSGRVARAPSKPAMSSSTSFLSGMRASLLIAALALFAAGAAACTLPRRKMG